MKMTVLHRARLEGSNRCQELEREKATQMMTENGRP